MPVPADPCAEGRPVYFGDVVVRADSPFASFKDVRGCRWAYNERNSRSGWFSMVERIAPEAPPQFFGETVHAGSHLASLRLVRTERAEAAAIDSNVLLAEMKHGGLGGEARVLESRGPHPIQPTVIRTGVPAQVKALVRESLLGLLKRYGEGLRSCGFLRFVEARRADYEIWPTATRAAPKVTVNRAGAWGRRCTRNAVMPLDLT